MALTGASSSGPAFARGPRFRASFGGSCTECGGDFDEGDEVGYARDTPGIMHESCADDVDEENAKPAPPPAPQ